MRRPISFYPNFLSFSLHTTRRGSSSPSKRPYTITAAAGIGVVQTSKSRHPSPRTPERDIEEQNTSPNSKAKEGKKGVKMPSSKGKPTDPELREEVKEEVKGESKGGGSGSWSAWKAGEMARRYEDRGGDYDDTGENKNKAQKGAPEKK